MPRISTPIKLFISLALLGWLFAQLDLATTWALFQHFELIYLVPIVVLSGAGIFLSVWKWALLLKAIHASASFVSLLRLFWMGLFFNNFLPGRTGGDLIRIYGLSKTGKSKTRATYSVVLDRLLNLIALVAIGLVAFICYAHETALGFSSHMYWSLLVLLPLVLFLFPSVRKTFKTGRLSRWFQELREIVRSSISVHLISTLALALLYQTTMILSHVAAAQGFGQTIAIEHFFYIVPITALTTLIPISLNGIGLREGAFALTFTQVNASAEAGVALSLLITLLTMAISALGGIFYILEAPAKQDDAPQPNLAHISEFSQNR